MTLILKLPSARSFIGFGRCAVARSLVAAAIAITAAIASPAQAQTGAEAAYAVTYLDVGTGSVPQGVELLKKYRDLSGHEAGNLEFTALQETSRPNRLAIVEGWKDQAAFDAHAKAASSVSPGNGTTAGPSVQISSMRKVLLGQSGARTAR